MAKSTFGEPRSSGGGAGGGARDALASLPASHRREYVGHITEAKKRETRARRVQRTLEMLRGKGAGRST